METILFGKLNSRKKYTQKVVMIKLENSSRFLYYEKKNKKWVYITDDIDKIPCTDEWFLKLKQPV